MTKPRREPRLSSDVIALLASKAKREGERFVRRSKARHRDVLAERIPPPRLPARGSLTRTQQWRSLLWMIDTAQAHGTNALRGLTIALARMIQADAFRALFFDARPHRSPDGSIDDLLWDRDRPVTRSGSRLEDLLTRRRIRDRIELEATATIAGIWEPWRLARALEHLGSSGSWGSWRQDSNHHAVCWHPWPLVWIDNGNHSATTATLKGGGTLTCEQSFDATPLLRAVTTNGRQWFGEDRRVLGSVNSLPMAGVIEVGRRLIAVERPR